jgi:hypothetical protein
MNLNFILKRHIDVKNNLVFINEIESVSSIDLSRLPEYVLFYIEYYNGQSEIQREEEYQRTIEYTVKEDQKIQKIALEILEEAVLI